MIQDLHAHTYYSFCGGDRPETVVEAAIAGGVDLLGITDHNYGIGFGRTDLFLSAGEGTDRAGYERMTRRYFDHLTLIQERYQGRIRLLRGVEICTLGDEAHRNYLLPEGEDVSFLDFCLIENLDHPASATGGDLFAYAARLGCPVGVAHTDLFAHIRRRGEDPRTYFRRMAEAGIFWELNVNRDSIHGYREHAYVADFLSDPEKQRIVREAGARVSVGFDGHRAAEYDAGRVAAACRRLTELGIRMPFEP